MDDHQQPDEQHFVVDQNAENVQGILQRIDEILSPTHLSHPNTHLVSQNESVDTVTQDEPDLLQQGSAYTTPPVDFNNLTYLANWLKMSSAPLRPSIVGGVRGMVWRVFNAPVRLFLTAQIAFNQNLRAFIGELMVTLQAINGQLMRQVDGQLLADVVQQVKALEDARRQTQAQLHQLQEFQAAILETGRETKDDIHRLKETIETLQGQLSAQTERLERQADRQAAQDIRLQLQDDRQLGTEKWLQLLGATVYQAGLEKRAVEKESTTAIRSTTIIRPEEFARKIDIMQGNLKINLGSGNKALEDYINVDFRELPGLDLVSDVYRLPFPMGSLAEIASAHLVEHFREYELKTRLLPYWFSLLQPNGMVRITCPNWQAMIDQLQSGEMSHEQFKLLTFGGQDYDGNDHFAMYTPESLTSLLKEIGFVDIVVVVEDRDNGGCPEMELTARKVIETEP